MNDQVLNTAEGHHLHANETIHSVLKAHFLGQPMWKIYLRVLRRGSNRDADLIAKFQKVCETGWYSFNG